MKNIRSLFLNEFFILALIILNAIVLFIEEFEFLPRTLDYVEATFTILFIMEMLVKTRTFGFTQYIRDNWNKMDFLLVLISIPSLAILFHDLDSPETNVVLSLRVLRVFKSFRLIKFMPDVNNFMNSIKRAIRASYVILLGFFVLIFITAMISCTIFKDIAPEYFRNPVTSIYSIFQLFSIEGWYEIPDLIASRTNESFAFFTKFYFSALLMIGGILGLSLVNSIFVDAMVADNNDDLERKVKNLTSQIESLESKIDRLLEERKDG